MIGLGILGAASVDIGLHWDEPKLIASIQTAAESGWLVPRWYNYPSMCFDVALLVAVPHGALSARFASPADQEARAAWAAQVKYLGGDEFKYQLRAVFFVLSCLTGLAVYYLGRGIAGSDWIGLFAGLTLIASWEFTYHAKWIAPDCLVALFAAGSLLGQYGVLRAESRARRFLMVVVAAGFAGLTLGTKYPGGIVLVPLLLAMVLSARRGGKMNWRHEIYQGVLALSLVAATFLVTTPGCFLDPRGFSRDLSYEMAHYGQYGHAGYTVMSGRDHFSKMMIYLGTVALSESTILAVAASILVLVGIAHLARTQPRIAVWFLALPLLYIAYMSSQKVMIVRNCVLLLPFMAVLAGVGLGAVGSVTRRTLPRAIVGGAAAFFVLFNVGVAVRSACSILYPNTEPRAAAIAERVTSSPDTRFYVSPACRAVLAPNFAIGHANVVESPTAAERFIFLSAEVPGWRLHPANLPGRYRTIWSQVREVNWDYYPSWLGRGRVLEVSTGDPELELLRQHVVRTAGG